MHKKAADEDHRYIMPLGPRVTTQKTGIQYAVFIAPAPCTTRINHCPILDNAYCTNQSTMIDTRSVCFGHCTCHSQRHTCTMRRTRFFGRSKNDIHLIVDPFFNAPPQTTIKTYMNPHKSHADPNHKTSVYDTTCLWLFSLADGNSMLVLVRLIRLIKRVLMTVLQTPGRI